MEADLFTHDFIEETVSQALVNAPKNGINPVWVLVLVLNRIEGHLARLAEHSSETPELEDIAGQLSHLNRLVETMRLS